MALQDSYSKFSKNSGLLQQRLEALNAFRGRTETKTADTLGIAGDWSRLAFASSDDLMDTRGASRVEISPLGTMIFRDDLPPPIRLSVFDHLTG